MNAFVIGDADTVTGFRLVGIDGVEVSTANEAKAALSKVVEAGDITIVILNEEFSAKMRDEVDKLRLSHVTPLIVEIPGRSGPSGEIVLTDMIREAIGIEI